VTEQPSQGPPNRKGIVVCIVAVIVLSVIGWLRLRIDTSLEPMLPESHEARKTLAFMRDSSFASKAVLWFRLTDKGTPEELFAAADATEKNLDSKLISRVIRPPRGADALEELLGILDHAGELLTPEEMAQLDPLTTPESLDKRLRECYMQLLKPEGTFMQPVIRRDPLGLGTQILGRLRNLAQGMGYKVEPRDGRLLHADGRQLLLIVETSSSATSLEGSEALAAHLRALAAAAPPNVQILPICPQIHTAENHRRMERDMRLAGIIDAAAFLLLFLVVRRDWRVAAVFLLPLLTVGITIGLCGLFHPNLSAIVIGMSATMAGSAVDYGIFVYTAIWLGSDPRANIARIRKPLIISHLTTLGVFFAFLFSDIPAYRQLGWMTSLSLVLSLLAALYVLPAMLKPGGKVMALKLGMPLEKWGRKMVPAVALAGILMVVGTILALKVSFDSDITQLDGIDPSIRQAEKTFQSTWGESETEKGLLVATGKTRDEAELLNDQVTRQLSGKLPRGEFVSLSSFWPSMSTQRANLARWQAFWTPDRIAEFRKNLAAAGAPYDFSAKAFEPFFASLAAPPKEETSRQILSSIETLYIARSKKGDWQILNFFEDTPENVKAVAAAIRDTPNTQVVARSALSDAFAKSARSETTLLVSISVAFIVVSLLVMTRSPVKSFVMMLPAITGIIGMLAVMTLMSIPMSVVIVVAAIMVLALASDYGIFAVFAWDRGESTLGQGMASVHLSSITTLIGTGALLLAIHPAMFLVGISMTSGLLVGYLTAFFVIPGICYLLDRRKKQGEA
jgi:uncharacterized protein